MLGMVKRTSWWSFMQKKSKLKNALQAAGSVSFYKTSLDDRIHYCQLAWDTIEKTV